MNAHQARAAARGLGRSTVEVSRMGLGCAPLADMHRELTDEQAVATVWAALSAGIGYFDTAPHYGLGVSDRRLGLGLAGVPRDSFTVSTKVGRLVPPISGTVRDEGFRTSADHRSVWDFSRDGILRSIEASADRLGLDRIDLVLLHDPEHRMDEALDEGYAALHDLRGQGVVGAIGVGSMNTKALTKFAAETEPDALMVAGRYTLLDQTALDSVLPMCLVEGITVLNAAVFNSGLLAYEYPGEHLTYDYARAPAELVARARAIAKHCARHSTTLPVAALAFAGSHPAVGSIVVGADSPDQVERNAALLAAPAPAAALWQDLEQSGLLHTRRP